MHKGSFQLQLCLLAVAQSIVVSAKFLYPSSSGIIPNHLLLFSKTETVATLLELTYSFINSASQNVSFKSWVQLSIVIKVNRQKRTQWYKCLKYTVF